MIAGSREMAPQIKTSTPSSRNHPANREEISGNIGWCTLRTTSPSFSSTISSVRAASKTGEILSFQTVSATFMVQWQGL